MPRRQSDLNLRISLEFNKTAYKASHKQKLHFSITNESSEVVRFLKWHTPFEGFKADMFQVQHSTTGPAPYLGPVYKRGAPVPEDYLTLKAGQSVERTVDFTDCYDMTAAGHYAVRYRKQLLHT